MTVSLSTASLILAGCASLFAVMKDAIRQSSLGVFGDGDDNFDNSET